MEQISTSSRLQLMYNGILTKMEAAEYANTLREELENRHADK